MLRKCTVLISVLVAVQSASFQGRRSIPVEVRYERLQHDFLSHLSEKVQLSPEELKENQLRLEKVTAAEQETISQKKDTSNGVKNLQEKVQLSSEELLQASKHIPIHNSLRIHQDINELERLGELRNEPTSNKLVQIDQIQDIVKKGIEQLKANLKPEKNYAVPSKEAWEKLEMEVKDYFTDEKNKLSKQDSGTSSQSVWQNAINWLQTVGSNLISNTQQQNPITSNGTSEDEETSSKGPMQAFYNYVTGGIQNIVSTLQNQVPVRDNSTTVLGDSETGGPGNILNNVISGVQHFIGEGPQQVVQAISGNSTQNGTGGIGTQGGNPLQNIWQSIGTAVNNQFGAGGANKTQGSEDENGSQASNPGFIQTIGQNFNNVIQNFQNQFIPQSSGGSVNKPATTAAPPKQSEDSTVKEGVTEKNTTESEKSEEMTATE